MAGTKRICASRQLQESILSSHMAIITLTHVQVIEGYIYEVQFVGYLL